MASFAVPCPKCPSPAPLSFNSLNLQRHSQKLPIHNGLGLILGQSSGSSLAGPASSGFQCLNRKLFSGWKLLAKLNEATTAETPSNSAPVRASGSGVGSSKEEDEPNEKPLGPSAIADASSVTAFMAQVSDLVKLVDSRDIVELQLKQLDCELLIRKKEAVQPPPAPILAPVSPQVAYPVVPSLPLPAPAAGSAPANLPSSKPAPPSPTPGKASPSSSIPPLKCPMAGTFYRSPAPGEPPFVKVGDKVQKGQVVCIIEAMKLMNEIEADQSGTITEILAEDGKSVSVDMPLFVIAP
ncbi:biotin carboxyl carrier protein of acetyl-CoA carboxylase 2, chloroplastic [Prosopis cineraria]|uniref:biotin carboxyl carrier protein of acetyl-CoA carboxylase 2, chloroplastic n=1 Tax=Prosopis cineraria TaxID=364024 RepID=UPI00240F1043|nr:biotin carboxyl carrier protein of acetyl-CoA carboxylase 2, chloroplastic [Prosopis cineraria]